MAFKGNLRPGNPLWIDGWMVHTVTWRRPESWPLRTPAPDASAVGAGERPASPAESSSPDGRPEEPGKRE